MWPGVLKASVRERSRETLGRAQQQVGRENESGQAFSLFHRSVD